MLSPEAGLALAEQYVAEQLGADYWVRPGSFQQDEELFIFDYTTREYVGILLGPGPVIIDRRDGSIHAYGSATGWEGAVAHYRGQQPTRAAVAAEFPGCRAGTERYTLTITQVYRKWPLLQALTKADLSYVVPEARAGVIWRVPRRYDSELLEQRLRRQPTRFDDVAPEAVLYLYPLLKQPRVCRFELAPYEPRTYRKYPEQATAEDYEPRW
ncbi:hypothetical protein [Hymenobacter sp. CRA2]|uniref:hypothetical protein n=1 Tax=Hymenobacter sp. CRA2 TaxID=1955620 RepID=UPI00098F9A15|nr:hypothetical protein [Hymenobacter sp. CRA2]OON66907.1 hypothetical protein B0919_20175 [Hymenobacter sp. CRA2]